MSNKHLSSSAITAVQNLTKDIGAELDSAMGEIDEAFSGMDAAGRTLDAVTNGTMSTMRKVVKLATMPAGKVSNFMSSCFRLMALPAKVAAMPAKIISTYKNTMTNIATKFKNDPIGAEKIKNQGAILTALFCGGVAASCFSVATACVATESAASGGASDGNGGTTGGGFRSREEAIAVMEDLRDFYEQVEEFKDTVATKNAYVDADFSGFDLTEMYETAVSMILNTAFSLKSRNVMVLGADRQMVELCFELYGDLRHLDEFIAENALDGDVMQMIPAGREVAYYA